MSSTSRIVTSIGYALALMLICAIVVVSASHALADEGESSSAASSATALDFSNAPVASEKHETVVVDTHADGTVKGVKVSTTLKTAGNTEVADVSDLTDIESDDSNVRYSNEGGLVWHTNKGENVVYTGTSTADLPLEIKVTYRYNGSDITPDKLAGKTGHVAIRYDYVNKSQLTVDGVQVYTPFVVITGLQLDSNMFSNVQVTNGRLVEDGDHMFVMGYAMPGLASGLDAGSDLDVPEYFEVEADAVDFELKSTLTIALPDMLDSVDASMFDMSGYTYASSDLRSAMYGLISGSNELSSSLWQLADGASQHSEGATQLGTNLASATSEASTLVAGIAQLHSGSTNLVSGIGAFKQQLVNTKGSLYQMQQEAAQISSALESGQLQQLATVLTKAAQELEADSQVMAKIEELKTNVQNDVVGAQDSYNSMRSDVITAIRASNATDAQKRSLEDMINSYDVSTKLGVVSNDVADLASYASQLSVGDTQVAIGALQAADFTQLSAGAKKLASELQQVIDGLGAEEQKDTLMNVVAGLKSGADQLDQGLAMLEGTADELAAGVSQLTSGTNQIAWSASQLSAATEEAAADSGRVTEGLQQFIAQGVSGTTNAIDDRLIKLSNRFAAVVNASGTYKNFAGITDGTVGSVKFVFETEAIGSD